MSPFRPAIDPERQKYQDPTSILEQAGLMPGDVFIDAGCGGGFFGIPAAKIAGPGGKIFGFDVNDEAIASLKELAAKQGLTNVEVSSGDAEHTVLCEGCSDMVFFGLVIVHLEMPVKAMENARLMLRPGGRIVVFDWKKKLTRQGPPFDQRLSEGQVVDFIKAAGFGSVQVEDSGPYHYLITASV